MDWYFGHDGGDLVVPKDQEYFDRLPSPDSWSRWGSCGYGNFGWSNNFNGDKVGEYSIGSSENSPRKIPAARGGLDFNYNSLSNCTDSMDDIFLSSLLQDDAAGFVNNRAMSVDCFRAPYSPSAVSDHNYVSVSNLSHGNSSEQSTGPSGQVLESNYEMAWDQEGDIGSMDEDSSIEESVLTGLESVLCQMNDSTRLCFRDSLYRLAQSSKQHMSTEVPPEGLTLDKLAFLESDDQQRRSVKTGKSESETNSIDRAVANLMFEKVDRNVRDILPAISEKYEQGHMSLSGIEACNYGSNQAETFFPSRQLELVADSEVPKFSQQN